MKIDPWQAPLLVMAAIILLELLVVTLARRIRLPAVSRPVRTGVLLLFALLVVVVAVIAIGLSQADQLASVAASIATLAALWLTYRSYKAPDDQG